jgi:hypothetical protein
MKVFDLGWAVVKEEPSGIWIMCPPDLGDGYAIQAQAVFISRSKLRGLSEFLASIVEYKP